MKVRCGSCRTEFEVPGAGRFACPVCGSVNVVRQASGQPPPSQQQPGQQGIGGYRAAPGVAPGGASPPPPPPPPEQPLPRVQCPECEFTFVVGKIATATCPNCSAEVATGMAEEEAD